MDVPRQVMGSMMRKDFHLLKRSVSREVCHGNGDGVAHAG
jgi:hypothetical protein